jgi:hypothetical protein
MAPNAPIGATWTTIRMIPKNKIKFLTSGAFSHPNGADHANKELLPQADLQNG